MWASQCKTFSSIRMLCNQMAFCSPTEQNEQVPQWLMTHSYLVRYRGNDCSENSLTKLLLLQEKNNNNNKDFSPTAELKAKLAFQDEVGKILHFYRLQIPLKRPKPTSSRSIWQVLSVHRRYTHSSVPQSFKNGWKHSSEPRRLTSCSSISRPAAVL